MNAQEAILKISQLSFNGGDLKLDILNILNSVSVYETGDLTILYSGKVSEVSTAEIVQKLIQVEKTIELMQYMEQISGVVNCVNQIFSLFSGVERVRPEKIIVDQQEFIKCSV